LRRRCDLCYFCALIVKHTYSRNCSISPAGFAGAIALLAAVTLAIGAGFALVGAWLVLPFAGLEVLALGAAFLYHARQVAKNDEQQG
jgi:uncharacterized membrane protein